MKKNEVIIMERTIEELYMEWANTLNDNEEVDNAFTPNSEWKGHAVKGFVKFCLQKSAPCLEKGEKN